MNVKPSAALGVLLSGSLLLSGCSSMLLRDYNSVTVHSAAPIVEGDQLTIRVESYQDLVNALLYYITQGENYGAIRLYNYPYDVEKDLAAACREVTEEDPLGAYAVESINYTVTPIVSCYEAGIDITYRRTQKQVAGVVSATGASAIRTELQKALTQFQSELALRVSYLDGDEVYIRNLMQQAYFSSPATALGLPQAEITFYPEGARRCIVEVQFSYPTSMVYLQQQKVQLTQKSEQIIEPLQHLPSQQFLLAMMEHVAAYSDYDPLGGSTAFHALVEGKANSTGLALSASLLCQQAGIPCYIVQGTLDGREHTWNVVDTGTGFRHLDLSQPADAEASAPFYTDTAMVEYGYSWDPASVPACEEAPAG